MSAPLLEVDGLSVEFRVRGQVIRAVDELNYSLSAGQTLVLLGESGSGKSVSALTVMGLLERPPAVITGGEIRFAGDDLLRLPAKRQREYRGRKIAMIFQDALSALNPVLSVGFQIAEMMRVHEGLSRSDARTRAVALMDRVRIPAAAKRFGDYPHEFSGGMRQRIMIAMALALSPDILIADEPTTALDVTVQAQIVALLSELRQDTSMAMLLITHDLGLAADVADRVAVMYAGRIVETATAAELYRAPAHPYTAGLLASIPRANRKGQALLPIKGSPPSLAAIPSGCAFHPRCPLAAPVCSTERPEPRQLGNGRVSACHFAEEVSDG
ncbi:MAG TPA: ABC transporter ATP-binding protein [Mycobacteriales bacterium]|jgi:oligopeptide transport system ATP-binding protein|nr:ABC transporter ATP-binding protein [Mycobacteriales bacterium]